MPNPTILDVGDRAEVAGHGRRRIEKIAICLRPTTDPAAEEHFADVQTVELSEHGPPFVVVLEGGSWAYGAQVTALGIEKGDRDAS